MTLICKHVICNITLHFSVCKEGQGEKYDDFSNITLDITSDYGQLVQTYLGAIKE